MFCIKCGTELSDDSMFCTSCGSSTNIKNIYIKTDKKINKNSNVFTYILVGIGILLFIIILSSTNNNKKTVGHNESVLIVERVNENVAMLLGMDVILNNKKVASLKIGQKVRLVIPNGNHSIRTSGAGSFSDSRTINFTANSQEITFVIGYVGLSLGINKVKEVDIVNKR